MSMNRDEALRLLALSEGAAASEVQDAARVAREKIKAAMDGAPTDALKAKYQARMTAIEEAVAALLVTASPLSQTKLADLPGMQAMHTRFDSGTGQVNLEPGRTLAGRYEILGLLGMGGMGAVYAARDPMRGKEIALKVLLPGLVANTAARDRFMSEARLSSELSHPHIVNVFDVQNDDDLFFLTMEKLSGQTLRERMQLRLAARKPFDLDEVRSLLLPVCEALSYAHRMTVHRDIKPENIFITDDETPKLMDFGIARVISNSQLTQTTTAMGSAYYMAPEQLRDAKGVDGRADQYSLAVVAYEMLTGQLPTGMAEPLHELRKDVPRKVADAITRALSPNPDKRFVDMTEFHRALSSGKAGRRAVVARTTAKPIPGWRKAVAGTVIAVLLGAGGWWGYWNFVFERHALKIHSAVTLQDTKVVPTISKKMPRHTTISGNEHGIVLIGPEKNIFSVYDNDGRLLYEVTFDFRSVFPAFHKLAPEMGNHIWHGEPFFAQLAGTEGMMLTAFASAGQPNFNAIQRYSRGQPSGDLLRWGDGLGYWAGYRALYPADPDGKQLLIDTDNAIVLLDTTTAATRVLARSAAADPDGFVNAAVRGATVIAPEEGAWQAWIHSVERTKMDYEDQSVHVETHTFSELRDLADGRLLKTLRLPIYEWTAQEYSYNGYAIRSLQIRDLPEWPGMLLVSGSTYMSGPSRDPFMFIVNEQGERVVTFDLRMNDGYAQETDARVESTPTVIIENGLIHVGLSVFNGVGQIQTYDYTGKLLARFDGGPTLACCRRWIHAELDDEQNLKVLEYDWNETSGQLVLSNRTISVTRTLHDDSGFLTADEWLQTVTAK